jgi:hypothetical protein
MDFDHFNQHLLQRVRDLADASGVNVVVDPDTKGFSANESRLRMPPIAVLAENFPQREDLQAFVLGAVVHEIGHILHTNFAVRREYRMAFNGHVSASVASNIGQYIEDAHIESKQMLQSVENAEDLTRMWDLLFQKHATHTGLVSPLRAFEEYVFYRCRVDVLNTAWAQSAADRAEGHLRLLLQPGQADFVIDSMSTVGSLESSAHGVALAVSLLKSIGIEEVTDESGQESTTEPQEIKDPTLGESGPGDSSAPVEGGDAPEDDEGPEVGPKESESAGLLISEDPVVIAAQEIQNIQDELPEDTPYMMEIPVGEGNDLAKELSKPDPTQGMLLRERVLANTMYAQAKLSSLLKSQTECSEHYARSGKIVPSRLWKLKTGNLRVFKRTVDGIEHRCSIHLLLDKSLSTKGQIEAMKEAAAFLPIAFDAFDGVATAFSIFPGVLSIAETIKGYDQRVMQQLDEIAGIRAGGGTPLVAAVNEVLPSILDWEADRKILIVVTDGDLRDKESIRKQLATVEAQGIHLIGIGVGVDVSRLFANHIKIRHSSELTDALYHVMLRQMTQLPLAA